MIGLLGFGIGLGICMILWSWRTHREVAINFTAERFTVSVSDLEACDRDRRSLAAERLLGAILGFSLPIALDVLARVVGSSLPSLMVLWISLEIGRAHV